MSFPSHDVFWTSAAEFLEQNAKATEDRILAPDIFWWRFPKIFRYVNTFLRLGEHYDWLVVHKGEMDHLHHGFLNSIDINYTPVFANEVFVVFERGRRPDRELRTDHVAAFRSLLPAVLASPQKEPPTAELDHVLPDRGVIEKFESLEEADFKLAMNRFWEQGGYVYETLRDKVYYAEIDSYVQEYIGPAENLVVLDLCCGSGRDQIAAAGLHMVGGDISEVALRKARRLREDGALRSFVTMDAHRLPFADGAFDRILFIDAIEHVFRVDDVIHECARVLKPGGKMIVTVANRDSLHEIITRKLGHAEFKTNYQHIREFNYAEAAALTGAAGFRVERSGGIFLYPYWGVPGIDHVVRHLTDHDPEIVEATRELGRRAGPDYAYAFVLLVSKQT